jgi:hypothetical protein
MHSQFMNYNGVQYKGQGGEKLALRFGCVAGMLTPGLPHLLL